MEEQGANQLAENVREEIIAAVKAAGVVGAGGAGFPTHVKINASVDTILVNGAECEPLLRAHQQLMASESQAMLLGLRAVMVATGAQKAYVGLKHKYGPAIESLTKTLADMNEKNVELAYLPDIYPAGDEQVLVREITGRIVPEGGIPLQVGVVVANVETLINVAKALQGEGVIEKYVTIGGAVAKPITIKAPVGMSVKEALAMAGGPTTGPYAIIDGGPMMGKLIEEDAPITKTTGGLLVLPESHSIIRGRRLSWEHVLNRSRAVCCNCRACTDVCPRNLLGHGLEPHRIMQAIGHSNSEQPDILQRAMLCSECGACEVFGCTMGLSPRLVNGHLKKEFAKQKVRNPYHEAPCAVRGGREYRMIPTKRLVARLGLSQYDVKAPLLAEMPQVRSVKLLLSQHIGAPAKPIVAVGDSVSKGQLVAEIPEGAGLGANVHASIAGKVVSIDGAIVIQA